MNIQTASFTSDGSICALIDGIECFVPDNMGNIHRQALAEWEKAGNTIAAYQPPPATLADYTFAITSMMDAKASERRYDSSVTISTYVGSTNPQWAAEAQAFVAWRDAVWAYAYGELEKVQSGQRTQPSVDGFLSELPTIEWPS